MVEERISAPHWTVKLGLSLLLIAVSACGFVYLDNRNATEAATLQPVHLETPLDTYVPFLPGFAFAYVLYYLWLLLPVPILHRREDFYRAYAAFAVLQLIAAACFLVFPSHMVRPEVVGDGLSRDLVRWVYRVDKGWNVMPSLHVAHVTLIALLYWVYAPKWFPIVALGSALIAASTVLVKQHYLLDIPAGALLGFVCFRLALAQFPSALGLLALARGERSSLDDPP